MTGTGNITGSVLDRDSILEFLNTGDPLLEWYLDREAQLQPNGFDLTLKEVRSFESEGKIGYGTEPAMLSESNVVPFDLDGCLHLSQGSYLITLNEVVNLPKNVMALARPRSSLLRSGVAVHTAVWDAGYRGRSQALVTVYNPLGYRVTRGARLVQMVFMYLARPVDKGYDGRYQGENI